MSAVSVAVIGPMMGAAMPARAVTLLDLDSPPLFGTVNPYSLPFTAKGSSTTVSIAGFDLPGGEQTTNNGLFLGGAGPNLLGNTWLHTQTCTGGPPCSVDLNTFNDGTSVPALAFYNPGALDIYSQTIPTKAGGSYSLDFLYSNDLGGLLIVTATPLPGTLTLFGSALLMRGLIALGCRWTSRDAVVLAAA